MLVIGPDAPSAARAKACRTSGSHAAWLPFAPNAAMLLALGPTLEAARRVADDLCDATTR